MGNKDIHFCSRLGVGSSCVDLLSQLLFFQPVILIHRQTKFQPRLLLSCTWPFLEPPSSHLHARLESVTRSTTSVVVKVTVSATEKKAKAGKWSAGTRGRFTPPAVGVPHFFQVKLASTAALTKADGNITPSIFKPLKRRERKPLTEESTSSSLQEAAGFMGNVQFIYGKTGTGCIAGPEGGCQSPPTSCLFPATSRASVSSGFWCNKGRVGF